MAGTYSAKELKGLETLHQTNGAELKNERPMTLEEAKARLNAYA